MLVAGTNVQMLGKRLTMTTPYLTGQCHIVFVPYHAGPSFMNMTLMSYFEKVKVSRQCSSKTLTFSLIYIYGTLPSFADVSIEDHGVDTRSLLWASDDLVTVLGISDFFGPLYYA
jgi:hypothetical protein